jgi:hypothetical protein
MHETKENKMKDMHIDGFAVALQAFDDAMDEFARQSRARSNCDCGWARSAEPLNDGRPYTVTVYPATSNKTCDCECSCGSKITSKVAFNDILDDVKHVIFNDPATIVTFSDGSKVCVKACKKDTFNKETGLIYAIIKRLYANDVEKKTGYLRSTGLGEKISKLLANATDQKEAERERRKAKKAAKKAQKANDAGEKAAEEAVEKVYEDELTGEKGC